MSRIVGWIDGVLGRVTMYRLVWLLLALLLAGGVVLAAVGELFFSPLALLASIAVALLVAVGVNALIARLRELPAHPESSLITAGLVAAIMPPSLEPAGLLAVALAASLASASKYLVVRSGRHLLNPAAAGVLVVGVLGLGFSTWWIAAPPLLPLVALGTIAIAIRTRRGGVVGLAIAVGAVALTVRLMLSGTDLASALTSTLLSTPLVFLAGFMLTEPLTLPPRAWQRLLVAGLVGLLTALPLALPGPALGPLTLGLYMTPELALVTGNLLSALLAPRRAIRLELLGTRRLTPTSWEIELRPERAVPVRAGQYLELTVPHRRPDSRGTRRTFSVASAPEEDGTLRLGLRVPPERSSSFKRALLELEPGSRLTATGVSGDFLLPRDPGIPLLLVAGGIGVTPFVPQLAQAAAEGRDAVLVLAVSSTDEIAYAPQLGAATAAAGGRIRVLLAAPDTLVRMPEHWSWLGGRLDAERLLEAVPDAAGRHAAVSGPPALIRELRPALRRAGVRRVATDAFIGS
ncbi:FAD-dependent oxidoreductase [Homoserinibacter sp. YIM 151385]|uniref:FAD-dependent oxidoreductase n=1 Tax=Homoserinibacter sp. YIM 151385 TaxID=2985506 RepID=UPI0022F0C8EF|nr:FAD-dependent oxidoreductase [Homoserinibacter sp. YIM 151385]WBU36780.1 FAD-dependent oxidoreductase [Homoserinibacter sp. YIM 151385]